MNGISIAMQIDCECGNLISVDQSIDEQPPMLKELKIKCRECGIGYYLHIQEVKEPTSDLYKEV